MRTKKATINIIASFISEFFTILIGFVVPKLILDSFGTNTHGINQAVTQFLAIISLISAGLGSVTTAALYEPLATNDNNSISAIVNASSDFAKKVSRVFMILLILLSAIFPIFVKEFDYLYSAGLVLILGVGSFANYYFGLTYRMVLNADQKQYVNISLNTVLLIVKTILIVILINKGFNIHIVQLVSTLILMINPIFLNIYVKRKYKIDKSVSPNFEPIDQRWDAFGHQVASFLNSNIDLILLTIFSVLAEVSVFSLYSMILVGIRMTISSMTIGTQAAFGNMIAQNQEKAINKNIKAYEFFLHLMSIILYTTMSLLITSFVMLYTRNIDNSIYDREILGYLLGITGFLHSTRLPYQTLTNASGLFKETKKMAYVESIINLVISTALVIPFGMYGLLTGTIIAHIYSVIVYAQYSFKNVLNESAKPVLKRFAISAINILIIVLVVNFIPLFETKNYLYWIYNAMITTASASLITFIINFIFYKEHIVYLWEKVILFFK